MNEDDDDYENDDDEIFGKLNYLCGSLIGYKAFILLKALMTTAFINAEFGIL